MVFVTQVLLLLFERFGWLPARWAKGWPALTACASVAVAAVVLMLWFVIASALRRRSSSASVAAGLGLAVAIPCSWFATELTANRQAEAVRAIEAVVQT